MDANDYRISQLQWKISAREEFLGKVSEFAKTFVTQNGLQTKYEDRGDHELVVRELNDFGGFDVVFTRCRGSTVEAWSTCPEGKREKVLCFNCHPGGAINNVVLFFEHEALQQEFIGMMEKAEAILADKLRAQRTAEHTIETARQKVEKLKKLEERARLLGLA